MAWLGDDETVAAHPRGDRAARGPGPTRARRLRVGTISEHAITRSPSATTRPRGSHRAAASASRRGSLLQRRLAGSGVEAPGLRSRADRDRITRPARSICTGRRPSCARRGSAAQPSRRARSGRRARTRPRLRRLNRRGADSRRKSGSRRSIHRARRAGLAPSRVGGRRAAFAGDSLEGGLRDRKVGGLEQRCGPPKTGTVRSSGGTGVVRPAAIGNHAGTTTELELERLSTTKCHACCADSSP